MYSGWTFFGGCCHADVIGEITAVYEKVVSNHKAAA